MKAVVSESGICGMLAYGKFADQSRSHAERIRRAVVGVGRRGRNAAGGIPPSAAGTAGPGRAWAAAQRGGDRGRSG